MTTTAERIAKEFENGQWGIADLHDDGPLALAAKAGAAKVARHQAPGALLAAEERTRTRWDFKDGSAVVFDQAALRLAGEAGTEGGKGAHLFPDDFQFAA